MLTLFFFSILLHLIQFHSIKYPTYPKCLHGCVSSISIHGNIIVHILRYYSFKFDDPDQWQLCYLSDYVIPKKKCNMYA